MHLGEGLCVKCDDFVIHTAPGVVPQSLTHQNKLKPKCNFIVHRDA